jgi:hypothetical protein
MVDEACAGEGQGPTIHGFAWIDAASRGWPACADHDVASQTGPRRCVADEASPLRRRRGLAVASQTRPRRCVVDEASPLRCRRGLAAALQTRPRRCVADEASPLRRRRGLANASRISPQALTAVFRLCPAATRHLAEAMQTGVPFWACKRAWACRRAIPVRTYPPSIRGMKNTSASGGTGWK